MKKVNGIEIPNREPDYVSREYNYYWFEPEWLHLFDDGTTEKATPIELTEDCVRRRYGHEDGHTFPRWVFDACMDIVAEKILLDEDSEAVSE